MLFNSTNFLVFISLTLILYYLIPVKQRGLLLLISSLIFYSYWKLDYIFILLICILINYFGSIKISKTIEPHVRKIWLIITISLSLSILAFFKYLGFVIDNLIFLFGAVKDISNVPLANILLPIGISFFTLQAIAYTIDVYNKKVEYEPNILKFSLFVSFFPQLLAGPIERAGKLIPQLSFRLFPESDQIYIAIKRILWGFFKKIVIADNLAGIIDIIYNDPSNQNGLSLLIATYLFALQIYCDFSGYVDIAIGIAKFFNIDLSENFQFPYKSQNIKEFWKRWHITLSNWFKDYVYIPLGGNRVTEVNIMMNITIVFGLSGLWHGANWTFLAWGLLNGFYYVVHHYYTKINSKYQRQNYQFGKKILRIFITFNLVCFAWIFFRSNSINDAQIIIYKITSDLINIPFDYKNIMDQTYAIFLDMLGTKIYIIFILTMLFVIIDNSRLINSYLSKPNMNFKYLPDIIVTDLIILSILFFAQEGSNQFIYFQF